MQAPLSRVVRTMWSMWSIISRRPGALRSFPLEFLARVLEGFLHALESGFGAFHHVRTRAYRSALQPAQLGHRCIALLAKLLELFQVAILGGAARRFPLRHLRVPLLNLLLQLLHVLFAVDHGVSLSRRRWHSIPMTDSLELRFATRRALSPSAARLTPRSAAPARSSSASAASPSPPRVPAETSVARRT